MIDMLTNKGGIIMRLTVFWVNIIGRIGNHLIDSFDLGGEE